MRCKSCDKDTQVLGTRYVSKLAHIRRRRRCLWCAERFTTYEVRADFLKDLKKNFRLAIRRIEHIMRDLYHTNNTGNE